MLLAAFALTSASTPSAGASQSQATIALAAAPLAPRIVGAAIVGARPFSPFLYTIAATGQRPMTFAAVGLPAGLSIDSSTGQISGAAGPSGTSVVAVTATNAVGSDHRALTLAVGSVLALTPPMGWNSYDSFDDAVTESDVLSQAQSQLTLLQPHGWQYVVVDYRWYDPNAPASNQNQPAINPTLVLDANGRFLPAPNRFPSASGTLGFGVLAARVHSLGLQFGIHVMRGIPRRAVQANTPIAGSAFRASDAANQADVSPWNSDMYGVNGGTAAGQAWYDSVIQQYSDWGIDFIKVDDLLDNQVIPNAYHQSEVDAIRRSLDKASRSIVLSLSPGEMPVAAAADLTANANMWRMANDFWDVPSHLDHMFVLGAAWQSTTVLGHWPDADMLPLGSLGPHCPVNGNHLTRFTKNEQVSLLSYWAILPSPLMLGANLVPLPADVWTTALLTNDEVLAVQQDPLGQRARRVAQSGTQEVWARDLSLGRKAVALFNHDVNDQPVSVTWGQLGLSGAATVRDAWQRADTAAANGGLSVLVPYRGAAFFVVTPQTAVGPVATEGGYDEGGPRDSAEGAAASLDGDSFLDGSPAADATSSAQGDDSALGEAAEGGAGPLGGSGPDGSLAEVTARSEPSGCACSSTGQGRQGGPAASANAAWLLLSAAAFASLRRGRRPASRSRPCPAK